MTTNNNHSYGAEVSDDEDTSSSVAAAPTITFKVTHIHDRNYLKWRGEYTRGESWVRGTNVELRPSAGLVLTEPLCWHDNRDDVDPVPTIKDFIRRHEEAWGADAETYARIGIEMMDKLGCELGLLRGSHPAEIIANLNRYPRRTFEEVAARYKESNIDFASFLPNDPKTKFLQEDDDTLVVLFKQEAIVKELEAVSAYGKEHSVTFHWI